MCGLAANGDDVHQADIRLPVIRLRSLVLIHYITCYVIVFFKDQPGNLTLLQLPCTWNVQVGS